MYFEETVDVPGGSYVDGLGWGGFLNPVRAIKKAVSAPVQLVQKISAPIVSKMPPFVQRVSPIAVMQKQIQAAQQLQAKVAPIVRKTSPIAVIQKQMADAKALRDAQLKQMADAKALRDAQLNAAKKAHAISMAITARAMTIGRKQPAEQTAAPSETPQYSPEQAAADAKLAQDQAAADAQYAAEQKQADDMWRKWQADQQQLPPLEQPSNDAAIDYALPALSQDVPSMGIEPPPLYEPPEYVPYEQVPEYPTYDSGEFDMQMGNLPSEILVNPGTNLRDGGMGGIWSDIMGGVSQLYGQKLTTDVAKSQASIQQSQAAQADAVARAEAARAAAIAAAQKPALSMPLMLGLGGSAIVLALMMRR